jgi:hypothetical protein
LSFPPQDAYERKKADFSISQLELKRKSKLASWQVLQKKKVNAAELEQNSAEWQHKSMQIRANAAVQREQVAVAKQNHFTSLLTGTDANIWPTANKREMVAAGSPPGRKRPGHRKITHALLSRWEKDLSRSVSRPHAGNKGGACALGGRRASTPSPTDAAKRTASGGARYRPGSAGEVNERNQSPRVSAKEREVSPRVSPAARPSGGLSSPVKARKGEFHAPNIPLITLANAADNLAKTTRTALKSWNTSLWTPMHDIIDGSIAIINFWSFSKETSTVPVDM